MSLLGLLKRQTPEPPAEVIQAVCDLYGLSPERIASIQAEKLSARSGIVNLFIQMKDTDELEGEKLWKTMSSGEVWVVIRPA